MPRCVSRSGEIVMHTTMPDRAAACHHLLAETRPRMVKADLRKAETDGWRKQIGAALQRATSLVGWSLKEFAAAVNRDSRQCARWFDGTERPQLDVLFAIEELRQPLVQALAEVAGQNIEVTTVVTMRRRSA